MQDLASDFWKIFRG